MNMTFSVIMDHVFKVRAILILRAILTKDTTDNLKIIGPFDPNKLYVCSMLLYDLMGEGRSQIFLTSAMFLAH